MNVLLRLVQSKEKMKMRFKASIQVRRVVGVILLVCDLQLYGQQTASGGEAEAKAATYITFDSPGSTYTRPQAINPAGTITGSWGNASGTHGFLRSARDGTLTTFDPPGTTYTQPQAINPAGAITGNYTDANGIIHGFLRIPAHRDDDTEGDNNQGDETERGSD
jgi:hypothetical protein